jgi:hypothetical protein
MNIQQFTSTYCQRCGESIRSADTDREDIFDKIRYHMREEGECTRDYKLKILLGEIEDKPLAQEHYQKDFNYANWLLRLEKYKENHKDF